MVTVNNKPTLVTEPTNVISNVTDTSRRQSQRSFLTRKNKVKNEIKNCFKFKYICFTSQYSHDTFQLYHSSVYMHTYNQLKC